MSPDILGNSVNNTKYLLCLTLSPCAHVQIHYTAKSMWIPDQSHPYVFVEHTLIDFVPFTHIITFILLGSLLNMAHSATSALVSSGTDVG